MISLVSLGLRSHLDLSLRGLEWCRSADRVYLEGYTDALDTTLEELGELVGRPVKPLTRKALEEDSHTLLEEARGQDVAILVGGDALSATTHISLLVDARRMGIPVRVSHGSSIFTAVAETGLSLYKFGKAVTVPLPEKGGLETVLGTIEGNREQGLHTLLLLDLDVEAGRHLSAGEAAGMLVKAGLEEDNLMVAAARLGSPDRAIVAGTAGTIAKTHLGDLPHILVAPGPLHFMEAEALQVLHGCPRKALDSHNPRGPTERLVEKYTRGCRRVLAEMRVGEGPWQLGVQEVRSLVDHAQRYLEDAEYYALDQRPTALACVAYAEGVLDALKLLGLAEFEW